MRNARHGDEDRCLSPLLRVALRERDDVPDERLEQDHLP
jgi:hypothetical protein